LSNNTNSGKLINSIEFFIPNVNFYKTNIVKCLPLKEEKIRYPFKKEMETCFFHLENEIDSLNPRLIFLLGKQVSEFVLNKYGIKEYSLNDNFEYKSFKVGNYRLVPIHHPSYILVYKRKRLQDYMKNIESIIKLNNQKEEVIKNYAQQGV
jgi:DNA polymerase